MFNSKAKTLKECPLYQARLQGFTVCYEEIGEQDEGEGGGKEEGKSGNRSRR